MIAVSQSSALEPSGLAERAANRDWDAFLERSPLGHMQQSSGWAQCKQADGWQAVRHVVRQEGRITGGFQLLMRRTPIGRVGYIYKGPVISPADPDQPRHAIVPITECARAHGLRAVIVQRPDQDQTDTALWTRCGFHPNRLVRTIAATLVVDLSLGDQQLWRNVRRSTRAEIRQARDRGMTAQLGGQGDIGDFFDLMTVTCTRQHTTPAPATPAALNAVWQAFGPAGKVKLFLARCEGATVAGLLCLCFGRRVVAWKKGWSGQYAERNPNQLIAWEAIAWAAGNGYQWFDWDALDPAIAGTLLRGEALNAEQRKSRHFFTLAFGGLPTLLPSSLVFVTNPVLRSGYAGLLACGGLPSRMP